MSEEDLILIGTLQRIVFSNPENGFLIGSFQEEKSKNSFTIKGYLLGAKESQTLHLKGVWENDPKYGKQFKVKEGMPVEPTNREGILSYLSSGDFPGIGPKKAEALISAFSTISGVFSASAEQLSACDGVGTASALAVFEMLHG